MQFVCKNCFTDNELQGFISSQGNIGNCNCCESENVEIISIDELLGFFKELFDNFQPKSTGKSLISLIDDNWNLFSSLDIGHKILNFLLSKMELEISNSEDLVDFNDDIYDNINQWFILKEQIKWGNRYLTDIQYLTDFLFWDRYFESKVKIKKDDIFYRARLHEKADEPAYSKENMSSPPVNNTTAGRANPAGIPYLYISDCEETVLYEVRASYLDEVSIATFKVDINVNDDILISDFTESPSLFQPNEVNDRIKSTLLKQLISRDLSKPMRRYDSELDYIPTQFICEFIKVFTNVQGIKFRSSLHQTGNNLVIFDQKIMDCIDVKKVQINKLEIKSNELI